MPGLQSIDSELAPLVEGNEALTDNSSMQPISSYQGGGAPYPTGTSSNIPISYPGMPEPSSVTPSSESSKGVQSQIQDIHKPSMGMMLLLGLLDKSGNAVNQYRQRVMQEQIEPIIGNINIAYRQALNAGDFTGAQKLVNQLGPLTRYSPNAAKTYEGFTNEIAKRQDNVKQNKILISGLLTSGRVKQGTAGYRYFSDPNTLLQDKDTVLKAVDMYANNSQVINGVLTTINKQTGEPEQQYPLPEATKAETLPKPTQDAIIAKLGPEYVQEYARLQTLVTTGKATNGESLAFNAMNKAISGQAGYNVGLSQFPVSERTKMNLPPGLEGQMLSPDAKPQGPQGSTQPQGNIQSKAPQGRVQKGVPQQGSTQNIAQQRVIFEANEMLRNGEISQEQHDNILRNRGVTVNQPQGSIPQSPYQQARQAEAQANIQETYGKETAINKAQYESRPQEQLVGYKLDEDGNLQRSPSGMSNAELNRGGWHAETFPDEQRKRLEIYPQFKGMYDHVKEEVLTNPVFKNPEKYSAWWDIAKTYFQQGLPIPFTSITAGGAAVGSEDRQRLSSALAVMGQMTELIANPSGKDNASIAALKNYITSPNAKPSGILSALDSVYETELAGIRGILGTTKGSVEPGRHSPTDIRRERESRTPGSSMEKRNVTEGESVEPLGQGSIRKKKGNALDIDKLEGVKGRLDRSKFKAVSP